MGREAIYHLKSERPKKPRTPTGEHPTAPFEADDDVRVDFSDDADTSGRLPQLMLSASGKAVRDTRRALKRTTKMLYRSLQKELPALFERVEREPSEADAAEAEDANIIPNGVARRAARGGTLEYLPGWTKDVPLNDGTHVMLRPLLPEDKVRLEEGFARLSAESRYQRFMTAMETLPDAYVSYLTEIDHVHHFAVAAAIEDPARFDVRGLGVARFIELPDVEDEAELAITILDEAQGQGLGYILMDVLLRAASERGFVALRAEVLPSNTGMQKLARRFGGERIALYDGMATWRVPVPTPEELAAQADTTDDSDAATT